MYYLDKKRDRDGSVIYRNKNDFLMPLQKDRHGQYRIRTGESVFVCLTSDFFLKEADEWRCEAWDVMRKRSDVNFSLLTKRPERVLEALPDDWGEGWDNVSFNVTCENQKRADERLPILLELPFRAKGVMCTPLLSAIDMEKYLDSYKISKVICGGENYDGARPCHYEWVKSLYEQCVRHRVPFSFDETGYRFVKDGKEYVIPRLLQHEQAIKSGLNYPERKQTVMIREKCRACSRRFMCKGCDNCGRCSD